MDLVDHHAFFCFDLVFRKCRAGGKFHKQVSSLAQIFLQHRSMKHNLLLGGESIEFSSQAVKVTVYHRSTSALCALEYGVLDEMSYAAVPALFIPCSALDAQGTICNGRAAFPHGIL